MALEGIDVSQWQGLIDWGAVARAGLSYAWAKATEGVGFEDPRWQANAASMAASPLVTGAYHFARPDLGNAPEAEADWFWQRLTARVGNPAGWLLTLDLEVGSGDLGSWRDRWCARVSQLAGGYLPGWYSYYNFIVNHGLGGSTPYWVWLAWPDSNGRLPAVSYPVSFQQYGLRSVPGIGGQVDADRFFGDAAQLAALTMGARVPQPRPIDPEQEEDMGDIAYVDATTQLGQQHIFGVDSTGALRQHVYDEARNTWASNLVATGLAPRTPVSVTLADSLRQMQLVARMNDGRVLHAWAAYGGSWNIEYRGDPDGGAPIGTTDPTALATALAGNPALLAAIAKAVNDEMAKRIAS